MSGAEWCPDSYHVCVTPLVRDQAAYDTSQAGVRRSPTGGAYGVNTCLQGYVWRAATPDDYVCVTPAARGQALADNQRAASRRDEVRIGLGTYNAQQRTCNGDTCSITSDDAPRYLVRGDRLNVGQALVVLFRSSTRRSIWYRWVTVAPNPSAPGRGGLRADRRSSVPGSHNAYFRVKDGSSGRWSSPQYVTTGCSTL